MSGYWTPAALATVKSVVSTLLFAIWFFIAGVNFWSHDPSMLLWLLMSGVVGIAIGDTALFYALYRMTERETLIVAETAAPILVVTFAFLLLGESLHPVQLAGAALVIIGVDTVIGIRKGVHFDVLGVAFALIAAACQAFGMIVSRNYLTQSEISAEETAFWRLLGASIALPLWLLIRKESVLPGKRLDSEAVVRLAIAILLGTFIGVLLLQIAVDRLPAGLAQSLIVTSVVFATLIGVLRGDKVTRSQWFGILLSVVGVSLIVI